MTAVIHRFPREATFRIVATPRGSIYDQAYDAVKTATDWPTRLGYAETLSQSPDWTHTALARHIRTAYSLHREGLLKPVDPSHRDRSDLIDGWKAAALVAREEETSARIAMRHMPRLRDVAAVVIGVAAAVIVGGLVL